MIKKSLRFLFRHAVNASSKGSKRVYKRFKKKIVSRSGKGAWRRLHGL